MTRARRPMRCSTCSGAGGRAGARCTTFTATLRDARRADGQSPPHRADLDPDPDEGHAVQRQLLCFVCGPVRCRLKRPVPVRSPRPAISAAISPGRPEVQIQPAHERPPLERTPLPGRLLRRSSMMTFLRAEVMFTLSGVHTAIAPDIHALGALGRGEAISSLGLRIARGPRLPRHLNFPAWRGRVPFARFGTGHDQLEPPARGATCPRVPQPRRAAATDH